MKFSNIRLLPIGTYRVSLPWPELQNTLDRYSDNGRLLNLDPDYQRPFVWSEQQKTSWLEFVLKGGQSGKEIYFANLSNSYSPNWGKPLELIDGKQRLNAILEFLNNKLPVYGAYFKDFEDSIPSHSDIYFNIVPIPTRKQVLEFYLSLNSGEGHTSEEIERVKGMLNDKS